MTIFDFILEVYLQFSHVFVLKLLKRNPVTAIFRVPSEGVDIITSQVKSIEFASLIARRLILRNWKSDKPPTFTNWIKEVPPLRGLHLYNSLLCCLFHEHYSRSLFILNIRCLYLNNCIEICEYVNVFAVYVYVYVYVRFYMFFLLSLT